MKGQTLTLDDVRRFLHERQGQIKAWAMTDDTFTAVAKELGIEAYAFRHPLKLFLIPVLIVRQGEAEGVVV
jgi:hypothetical protein